MAARVGLLPLYLELYDRAMPEVRPTVEAFANAVAGALADHGLDVAPAPVCRVADEFRCAVRQFEQEGVACLVTLHLAYSPSLESADAIAGSRLPIIALDTTPDAAFGPQTDPAAIMANHGIHGVQDLCSVLRRRGRPYAVVAGHWRAPETLARVAEWARAAELATALRTARVGLIGEPFRGMGDFAVTERRLREAIGIDVLPCGRPAIAEFLPGPGDAEIQRETTALLERCQASDLPDAALRASVRASLAVRRWIARERLDAFSVNFLAVGRDSGLPTMPFLETSLAMSRGVGYAGEGDVLTAAFVASVAKRFPASFTEMFCPDWEGGTVFLSHMGEANLDLLEGRPALLCRPFPWADVEPPVAAVGCFRAGEAALLNLAPGPADTFGFVAALGEMVAPVGEDRLRECVRGWFRPATALPAFLEAYSLAGGTHHLAVAYGSGVIEELERAAALLGWSFTRV
ncbi:MAG TPA: hypothetical protein VLH79_13040 [Chthonomonadales bacterium]|nr:hypothetical protein [Chthonomonadales bacterium]